VPEINSKYCPNCRIEVSSGAAYCPNCGENVFEELPLQEQQAQQTAPSGAAPPMVERPTPSETQQQVFMPPSGELEGGSRGGGLILGRLAELAVLGLVVVLLVGTPIYLFALESRSGSYNQDFADFI
jgi:hypothetical protein